MATVNLGKQRCNTRGHFPIKGETVADFNLVDSRLKNRSWKDFAGKHSILYIVPSLDTELCANTTLKLEQLASDLPDHHILVASADLPFAMQRFAKENSLKRVNCLSVFRDSRFGERFGVLLEDGPLAGLLARAIMIINPQQDVIYSELVSDVSHEPDFESLLQNI